MGLFSFVKKIKPFKAVSRIVKPVLKNPVKAVKSAVTQVVKNPVRYGAGVLSGGLTEALRVAPVVGKGYARTFDELYAPIGIAYVDKLTYGSFSAVQNITYSALENKPMALNIGSILGAAGSILGKTNSTSNPYVAGLGTALSLVGSAIPVARGGVPARPPVSKAPSAMTPMVARAAGGLTQEIFNAGNKVLQRLGIRYPVTASGFSSALRRSLGSIASLARRTPAGTIVNILLGLGLTAYEANVLTAWYSQRRKGRRMNPANSRALRRAARRIRSFHRLCSTTDILKTRSRSRAGKCGSCRKNPCSC